MTTFPGEARLNFLRPSFLSDINPLLSPSARPMSSAFRSSRLPGPQESPLGGRKEGRLRTGRGRESSAAEVDSQGWGAGSSPPPPFKPNTPTP